MEINCRQWGKAVLGLMVGFSSFGAGACGDDDDGGGPTAGSGGEPMGGQGGGSGSGGTASSGEAQGGSGGVAGEAPGGAGGAGGASGGAACSYDGESYEAGQRFVTTAASPELCVCEANGEVTCLEQFDACDLLLRDLRDVVDRAKTCDRDGPLDQCSVEASVPDFYCSSWSGLFTAEHVGALDSLTELGALSAKLDCDASITPCGAGPTPTESYCSDAGRCEDRWTGQNQLGNGGFEDEDVATPGYPDQWLIAPGDRPAYSLDSEAKSGAVALKLSVVELGHDYEVSQTPYPGHRFIRNGSALRVSGFYRIDHVAGDVSFTVRMNGAYYPINGPTEAGVWKEFGIVAYSSSNYRFDLGLRVEQEAGALATVWFDDVQVELLP